MVMANDPEQISASIIPLYSDDTKKAKYLSYRVANFSVMESCKLADCHIKSVRRWREDDANFNAIDIAGLSHIRKKYGAEYLNMEFTRNFKLLMQKDFDIIYKTVTGKQLTDQEFAYLLKIRAFYTPQQLAIINGIVKDVEDPSNPNKFNFTKLTMTLKSVKESTEQTIEFGQEQI